MRLPLPIDEILGTFSAVYKNHSSVILSAAPGAGKTTRIPVEVVQHTSKQVWVLEPRRIAAISAAQRIAEENGWSVGREVGYQVRFENKSSKETRLLFLTEALLLRKLLSDPDLTDVGCVILDEFHERSVHVDLALAALKELQELSRPDLKIVVMSATLDAAPLSQYLNQAPVVESQGKIFPLEIRYEEKAQLLQTGPDFVERMKKLVHKAAFENSNSDILVFLPGRGEIERLLGALQGSALQHALIVPLHGQLNLQDQRSAILPVSGQRKIILATNIAESSLTVQGVQCVVDSGLVRLQQQDTRTGFESLQLVRISKASAVQRAGRAARLGPGVVYRSWTTHDERSMLPFEIAEIERVDLSESLLLLAALGVRSADSFSWFEKPPARSLQIATDFLKMLGAVSSGGELTDLGKKIRQYPVHPRIAKLLLEGQRLGIPQFACEIAGILSEMRPIQSDAHTGRENDVMAAWETWRRGGIKNKVLDRAIEQLKALISVPGTKESIDEDVAEELLLAAYGDRLCRRRKMRGAEAKMVGGRGVKMHPASSVKESEFFLAIAVSEGRDVANATVFQAVGLHPAIIEKNIFPQSKLRVRVEWDEESQRFWSVENREWNGLPVGQEKRKPAQTHEVQEQLVDIAMERWTVIVDKNKELSNWLERLAFLHRENPLWPNLSEEQVREGLIMACYGESSLAAVESKDLVSYLENLLSADHREALKKQCPSHWQVPTGNRYKIQYGGEQAPQLEVRLQEMFGLMQTPEIAGVPLTLVLLAPNFRPVQVTRDIESFWKNGYPEVRKELRARYPKHSWPEDPLTALPQAKGRHHSK